MIWKHALEQHDSDHEDDEDEDYIEEFMPTGGDEGIALAEEEVDGDGLDAALISKPWKMSIIEPEDVEVPIGNVCISSCSLLFHVVLSSAVYPPIYLF